MFVCVQTKSAFADCLREEGDQEMLSAFHPQEETLPEERMEVQEVGDDVDDDATEVQEDISDAHVEELEEDEEREGEEREEVGEEEEEREEATDSVMGTQLEQCEEEDDAEVEPVEEDQGVNEELAMEVEEQEEFDVPAGQSPHSKGAPVEEEDSATVRINGKRTSEEMEASVEEEEEDQGEEETADEYAREGGIVQETREKDPHGEPCVYAARECMYAFVYSFTYMYKYVCVCACVVSKFQCSLILSLLHVTFLCECLHLSTC